MTTLRRVSLVMSTLAVCAAAPAARADAPGDAWAAAKKLLPSAPYVVVGANVSTIQKSTIYKTLVPQLLAKAGDVKEGLAMIRTGCGIDVETVIQGVVVSVDENEKGIIVVSVKGVDAAAVGACLKKLGQKEKKEITASAPDPMGIIEYTAAGERDKIYIAYLPKGVIAMATDPTDKSLLKKFLTSKGAKGPAAAALAKVNTGAAVWCVVVKTQELEPGVNMKGVFGSGDIAGGKVTANVHIVLANAKQATASAAKANQQLAEAKKGGEIPPALAKAVDSVKIAAAGNEMVVNATMTEQEVLQVIDMAMQ